MPARWSKGDTVELGPRHDLIAVTRYAAPPMTNVSSTDPGKRYWDIFDKIVVGSHSAMQWKHKMLKKMRQKGIHVRGRAKSSDDPKPYLDAAIWPYPCTGGERLCLTAIKAQRLGVVPVVIPTMALQETVRYGKKIAKETYGRSLIAALKNVEWQEKERGNMLQDQTIALNWPTVAETIWKPLWS